MEHCANEKLVLRKRTSTNTRPLQNGESVFHGRPGVDVPLGVTRAILLEHEIAHRGDELLHARHSADHGLHFDNAGVQL